MARRDVNISHGLCLPTPLASLLGFNSTRTNLGEQVAAKGRREGDLAPERGAQELSRLVQLGGEIENVDLALDDDWCRLGKKGDVRGAMKMEEGRTRRARRRTRRTRRRTRRTRRTRRPRSDGIKGGS